MIPNLRDPAFVGALVYFDRAAQRLSFKEAANDLGVTPSAVSHRISALESALGKRLFERETRRIGLTLDGAELAMTTRDAFALLHKVTDTLTTRMVLRVSVGPYFSANWLMPRLAECEAENPGLRIDLLHSVGLPDMRNVDVAIVWWDTLPPDMTGEALFNTDCVPVMASGINERADFWASQLPPIHYRDRNDWRQWLAAFGAPADYAERGEIFDDPNLVLEAAVHRRGIAMGFLPFIASQIQTGRLVRAHPFVLKSNKRYWLVTLPQGNRHAISFRDWIMSAAAKTQTSLGSSSFSSSPA